MSRSESSRDTAAISLRASRQPTTKSVKKRAHFATADKRPKQAVVIDTGSMVLSVHEASSICLSLNMNRNKDYI